MLSKMKYSKKSKWFYVNEREFQVGLLTQRYSTSSVWKPEFYLNNSLEFMQNEEYLSTVHREMINYYCQNVENIEIVSFFFCYSCIIFILRTNSSIRIDIRIIITIVLFFLVNILIQIV